MPDRLKAMVSGLLRQERDLYVSLNKQIDHELIAIDNDDMDLLLSILQEKQSIISRQERLLERWSDVSGELGLTEGREGPAFWRALSEAVDAQGYQELVQAVREIRDLGAKALRLEALAQKNLEAKVTEFREKMSRIAGGKKAVRGYMGNL
ncbi:MAG: flagellar biosynthesis protein FlgN [Dethiosulfovibrio peptidovorans]|nr:MAG: flagellar biosynthesis protein FlgN [Dethiosulfovibrio peptidovorans]